MKNHSPDGWWRVLNWDAGVPLVLPRHQLSKDRGGNGLMPLARLLEWLGDKGMIVLSGECTFRW
jgi:hypothetical protein